MRISFLLFLLGTLSVDAFAPTARVSTRFRLAAATESVPQPDVEEVDVVVVGAGIGGLSCAALSSYYGLETVCLEAHDTAGGVAHSFDRYSSASKTVPFRFDAGPSLISGCSRPSTNPLRQLLDAVGTSNEIEWKQYDGWIIHDYADGKSFKLTTGDSGAFEKALEEKEGKASREAFEDFKDKILADGGISEVSAYIPPFALRGDIWIGASLAQYFLKLLRIGTKGLLLTGPFSKLMDMYELQDEFVRKFFDYLAFALSGLDAAHTQAAPVAYMMSDLHKPGMVLDYPMGGMDSLIQSLVNGCEKHGGQVRVNSRVDRFLLEEGSRIVGGTQAECHGVVLADGKVIKARKGVVSNVPLWNMASILDTSAGENDTGAVAEAVREIRQQADGMEMTGSFMHLHLGIPKDGLGDVECHHSVLDFSIDVTAEQNMVIISIPTVFDPSLAPEGYHIVHAYTAACDSFDDWQKYLETEKDSGVVGSSPNAGAASKYNTVDGYNELKEQKAEVLWKAIECVIPDVRDRAKQEGSIVMIGTPLTHRRYNQRFRGTYGPAPGPGKDVWELPGASTKIKGLLACGDTTFPGIGLPGVAASGTVAANTLVDVQKQTELMNRLRESGALQ
ncbi:Prolycopene isomerase, chloroplastic [Seminavis robusta]|uniref:Prolycopene isomerase, chloroplastic n=1 Tax=Seminavis robusta TaxID=568900 RepID=A0A9N8HJL7_9STRA|nr:Prolycopene isomerase, chloroplastic [Seminavis robusta]|eukprot:Sro774_g200580.1 Prolycopene isomerase, chloroplastic (618) ;mRNA; f:2232-4162